MQGRLESPLWVVWTPSKDPGQPHLKEAWRAAIAAAAPARVANTASPQPCLKMVSKCEGWQVGRAGNQHMRVSLSWGHVS